LSSRSSLGWLLHLFSFPVTKSSPSPSSSSQSLSWSRS
jgi:hypothetical protein